MNVQSVLKVLEQALKRPKPGITAQLQMIPNPRPGHKLYFEVEDTCVKAGVLILLYPCDEHLHLVFTLRTEGVDYHQSQICFPGGRQEPGEELEQTSLRETCEELGILPESIHILGRLTPLYIPPTNYCIYPVVATTDERPDFNPSTYEVAEVLELPLDYLLNPENIRREVWTIRGISVEVPFYFFKGHKIWGATAMVLAELLEIIRMERLGKLL